MPTREAPASRGWTLDGSTGSGIQIDGVEVDVVDSRIRNCKVAGIEYKNAGRPSSMDGVRNDSGRQLSLERPKRHPTRWVAIATNPGFDDSIHLIDGKEIMENNAWRRQILPIRTEGSIYVDNQSSLVLEAGLELAMGSGSYINVGTGTLAAEGTTGTSRPNQTRQCRATLGQVFGGISDTASKSAAPGIGTFRPHGAFRRTTGSGIRVVDGKIGISDTRVDSNTYAGILFSGSGRAADDTSFARVRGHRQSLVDRRHTTGDGRHRNLPGARRFDLHPFGIGRHGKPGLALAENARGRGWIRGLDISGEASLRIDSGSTYVFSQGAYIVVGSSPGSLAISGTATAPVHFLSRNVAGWGRYPTADYGYSLLVGSEGDQCRDAASDSGGSAVKRHLLPEHAAGCRVFWKASSSSRRPRTPPGPTDS